LLTEEQKGQLVNHLQTTVEWRYPVASGANQFAFNPGDNLMVYRRGEPVDKTYPAVEMSFLPRSDIVSDGLGHVAKDFSGNLVYGFGELEPVIVTVYTHQICEGSGSYKTHGKLIADSYIRRIERYIRRYWPKLLNNMEAQIKESIPFNVQDISEFLQGTEKQGFEMTIYLVTTNKWDYGDQDPYYGVAGNTTPETGRFEDAVLSGAEYDTPYNVYMSVSGYMHDKNW